jgi:hypothetical protein
MVNRSEQHNFCVTTKSNHTICLSVIVMTKVTTYSVCTNFIYVIYRSLKYSIRPVPCFGVIINVMGIIGLNFI